MEVCFGDGEWGRKRGWKDLDEKRMFIGCFREVYGEVEMLIERRRRAECGERFFRGFEKVRIDTFRIFGSKNSNPKFSRGIVAFISDFLRSSISQPFQQRCSTFRNRKRRENWFVKRKIP